MSGRLWILGKGVWDPFPVGSVSKVLKEEEELTRRGRVLQAKKGVR